MKRLLTASLLAVCALPALAGDGTIRRMDNAVKDQYIIRLADTVTPQQVRAFANGAAAEHGGRLRFVWDSVVPGFSVELPEKAALALARHPLVEWVEENAVSRITQQAVNTPWHLDRIDQRTGLNGYYYQDCIVTDVYAYVMDTGVRAAHSEFATSTGGTRVLAGANFVNDGTSETNPCTGDTYFDVPYPICGPDDRYCFRAGHGTAVASILGGVTYGVAKSVKIIPVRTHDCLGRASTDTVIQGLQWVYNHKGGHSIPAVLNMSFAFNVAQESSTPYGAGRMTTMEQWITRLVDERNVFVVTGAGNENVDARNFSPARLARNNGGKVVTVGGTGLAFDGFAYHDRRWVCNPNNAWEVCPAGTNIGSNWGIAVDVFAPSQNIRAAGFKTEFVENGETRCCRDSNTVERQGGRSGTSFATPIVAGVAARNFLGIGSTLTPLQMWEKIRNQSSGDYPSTPPTVIEDVQTWQDPNAGPLNGSINRFIFQQGATRCRATF